MIDYNNAWWKPEITPNYIYIRSPLQQGARLFKFIILRDFDVTYFYMVNSLLTSNNKSSTKQHLSETKPKFLSCPALITNTSGHFSQATFVIRTTSQKNFCRRWCVKLMHLAVSKNDVCRYRLFIKRLPFPPEITRSDETTTPISHYIPYTGKQHYPGRTSLKVFSYKYWIIILHDKSFTPYNTILYI